MTDDAQKRSSGNELLAGLIATYGMHSLRIGFLLEAHLNGDDERTDAELYRAVVAVNDQLLVDVDEMFPGKMNLEGLEEARLRLGKSDRSYVKKTE